MSVLDPPQETPYTFLSLGAGVQSSCMALMAKHGEITPMPDAAIFADTQAEPRRVYEWLDWLEQQLPFPLIKVTAGNLASSELEIKTSRRSGNTYRDAKIPAFVKNPDGSKGIVGRKCTVDFKVRPITKHVRKLAEIKRGQKDITVTQWIGISWDEIQRMKEHREPWCQNRWPLLEMRMRRDGCIRWMNEHGYPTPPRSACTFCPFHCDAEWRKVKEDPDEWAAVIQFEKDMQAAEESGGQLRSVPYLHPSLIPIGEVDLRSDEEKGQLTFDGIWNTIQNECEGMCGI